MEYLPVSLWSLHRQRLGAISLSLAKLLSSASWHQKRNTHCSTAKRFPMSRCLSTILRLHTNINWNARCNPPILESHSLFLITTTAMKA